MMIHVATEEAPYHDYYPEATGVIVWPSGAITIINGHESNPSVGDLAGYSHRTWRYWDRKERPTRA